MKKSGKSESEIINDGKSAPWKVAIAIKVGLAVADEPPRESRRAVFPHRASLNGCAVEIAKGCSFV